MTLASRNFLDVRLSASGIKKPSLKSRAGLIGKRLVQFGVIIGDCRANGCEDRRHTGCQSNGQHHKRHCRDCHRDLLEHDHPRCANTNGLTGFVKPRLELSFRRSREDKAHRRCAEVTIITEGTLSSSASSPRLLVAMEPYSWKFHIICEAPLARSSASDFGVRGRLTALPARLPELDYQ